MKQSIYSESISLCLEVFGLNLYNVGYHHCELEESQVSDLLNHSVSIYEALTWCKARFLGYKDETIASLGSGPIKHFGKCSNESA